MRPDMTHPNRPLRSTSAARWAAGVALAGVILLLGALVLPTTAQATRDHDHGSQWGPAQSVDPGGLLGINTAAGEGCPSEAPDAHMLFFASNRGGGIGPGTQDIWVSFRPSRHSPWGAPVNVGAPVNSIANDFCPTPLPGNQLLFVSALGNQCGGPGNNPDIYYTRLQPSGVWLESSAPRLRDQQRVRRVLALPGPNPGPDAPLLLQQPAWHPRHLRERAR